MFTFARRTLLLLMLPLLVACDRLADLLELPDPQREAEVAEAEGRAIGSACRHAGRSLEDCYLLNANASKSAVFAGWRDMNDYMMQNKLEVVPSQLAGQGVMVVPPPAEGAEPVPGITPGQPFTPIQPPR
jgi:hypothetical protein